MINGKFWNGNGYAQIVECICTLNGFQYKVQIKYKRKEINGSPVCYMVPGSMKILERVNNVFENNESSD